MCIRDSCVGSWILPKATPSRAKRSLPVPTLLLRTPPLHYPHLQNYHPQISFLLPHFNYKITSSFININISINTRHIFPITTVSTSILLNFYYINSQQHYLSVQNNIFISNTTLTWTDLHEMCIRDRFLVDF